MSDNNNFKELVLEIADDPEIARETSVELANYQNLNLIEKSKLGETIVIERRLFKKAGEVLVNTIFSQNAEIEGLRHQMGNDNVDESRLDIFVEDKNDTYEFNKKCDVVKNIIKRQKESVKSALKF